MDRVNGRPRIAGAAAALMILAGAGQVASADTADVDVVGLKLGMTLEEAQAAIAAYNPDLQIQPPVQKILQYRVANETRKTEPFLSYLFAVSGKKQSDDIYVYFSLPPGEPRAVAITRQHNNFDPPIPREVYRKALIEKYGEPAATEKDIYGDESHKLHWYQWHIGDGKVQCVPHIAGGREVEGQFGSIAATAIEAGQTFQRITDPATGAMLNAEARDPSDCAVLLTYQLVYDPMFSAQGTLIDVAAAAKSEQEMTAWIDELVRKAEEEIQSSPAAPKL